MEFYNDLLNNEGNFNSLTDYKNCMYKEKIKLDM